MLASKDELKNISPDPTAADDEKLIGLQVHLIPVQNSRIPDTIEELEYGNKKNAK